GRTVTGVQTCALPIWTSASRTFPSISACRPLSTSRSTSGVMAIEQRCAPSALTRGLSGEEAEQLGLLHLLGRQYRRVLEPGGELHGELDLEIDGGKALVGED